jgi:hypothetical protein
MKGLLRPKVAWVAYAALLTFAVLAGEARNLSTIGGPDLVTLANWALTVVLLVALWGYALQRPLGHERYWRFVFWILAFATVAMLVPIVLRGGELARYVGWLLLPIVPAYVAVYLYAYRSPRVWGSVGPR